MQLLLHGKAEWVGTVITPEKGLWIKIPWDLWRQAAVKLLSNQCKAICVLTAWSAELVRSLVHTATRRLFVEMGTRLFQRNGKKL